MGMTYEEPMSCIRKADRLLSEALAKTGPRKRAGIRVAFYELYQAASMATMIAPNYVMEEALRSDDYTTMTEVLYRRYFKEECFPVENAREVFDMWVVRVKRFVEQLDAQAKLVAIKSRTETNEIDQGQMPGYGQGR